MSTENFSNSIPSKKEEEETLFARLAKLRSEASESSDSNFTLTSKDGFEITFASSGKSITLCKDGFISTFSLDEQNKLKPEQTENDKGVHVVDDSYELELRSQIKSLFDEDGKLTIPE